VRVARGWFTGQVILYGIASSLSRDLDDFYPSWEEAEAALSEIVVDEPDLEGVLWIEPIAFDLSAN
jgi:hypothetical protein